MKALLLRTNGTFEEIELKPKKYLYQSMADAIGAELVEIVQPLFLDDEYCIVCDESGLLKSNPQINVMASWFYGCQEHNCPIYGDAIIMKNKITNDGIETVGLNDGDIGLLKHLIKGNYVEMIEEHFRFLKRLIYGRVEQDE